MVFSKKSQVGKWVLTEFSIRGTLKPVKTKIRKVEKETEAEGEGNGRSCMSPTANEAKKTEKLKCPPAPRKRRPVLKCRRNVVINYFVTPLDLETVFIRRV
ncbi:hypothetical protein AALP_AA5G045300 [Arabis alpina]|uniref:Uncharacterized protein n=1 Tax=Arabis alpina TaxID=50452 RepID=A0A087GUX4_ARAAL|nr:hypothetical protein AALP_AA5G045300 [Arabis alpina]